MRRLRGSVLCRGHFAVTVSLRNDLIGWLCVVERFDWLALRRRTSQKHNPILPFEGKTVSPRSGQTPIACGQRKSKQEACHLTSSLCASRSSFFLSSLSSWSFSSCIFFSRRAASFCSSLLFWVASSTLRASKLATWIQRYSKTRYSLALRSFTPAWVSKHLHDQRTQRSIPARENNSNLVRTQRMLARYGL